MGNLGENKDDFKEMLEEYMPEIENGQIKNGVIISKDSEYGYLHIGGKSEGKVRVEEIEEYAIGDEIEILVLNREDKEGYVRVSRLAIEQVKNLEIIKSAYENEEVLEGKVIKKINGGYVVDLLKFMAFMPNSLSSTKNDENIIGKKLKLVIKLFKDGRKKKIVVSAKDVKLKEEKKYMNNINENDVLEVEIKGILEFGLSVNVGPILGFIHISEIAWKKIDNLNEMFTVGEKIKAKVITLDEEKRSLKLSIKKLKQDPWELVSDNYKIGDILDAKVVRTVKFGAFAELEEGLEGLIHISDLSWDKSLKNVDDYLKIDDVVKVKIIELLPEEKKLKLSVKDLSKNPWTNIDEKYPVGKIVEGEIVESKDFGIFVKAEEGVDIFVHISDIAWIKDDEKKFKIGDKVKLQILELDGENEKIKGGIKQLEKSPWEKIVEKYEIGQKITRNINNITVFGIFVEIENGIDGMIHISEASIDYIKKLDDRFEINGEVTAEIIEINNEEQKIKLSIKKIEEKEATEELEKYNEKETIKK
ncbi:MAG: S1 RNA-binding domain-containing protein [Fusobacteria bacterium]|nr:S1 RNA-binding domain-containing protein [Fusobacteriota bacterium]